jgi:Arc/MetJ-type ribon-helix-helix transcriptional regulator
MLQLTPEQQSFVDAQLSTGAFTSTTEIVDAAFELLRVRQTEHSLLAGAIAQVERGEVAELDVEDIKRRGRSRLGINGA